jgi:iron uptake system EfeUOB component EfeO/EfeM
MNKKTSNIIDKKTSNIIEQINALFSDTSVSKYNTIDSLEEIQSEIEIKIDCLKEDLRRESRDE